MATASKAPTSAPTDSKRYLNAFPVLDRALGHALGLRCLWHLVDSAALGWLVTQVDEVAPDITTRRHLRRSLELLRDDAGMPDVLRAALARLVVRSGVVPLVVLLASRYPEVRRAALLSAEADT